jgi:hypothetical protein
MKTIVQIEIETKGTKKLKLNEEEDLSGVWFIVKPEELDAQIHKAIKSIIQDLTDSEEIVELLNEGEWTDYEWDGCIYPKDFCKSLTIKVLENKKSSK